MILDAWRSGWQRVVAAPAIAAGVFVMTILLTLPMALVLREAIGAHLGSSLMADRAADGMNWDWWQEFSSQATGLGTTFTPSVIGFAATLDNISGVLDGKAPIVPIAWALTVYVAGWAFLSGGVVDRYARQRATRARGFFAASGVYFFRFIRLGIVVGIIYWWLFAYVHPWLFDDLFVRLTRNLSVERTAFLWRVALYAVFGGAVILVNLLTDYTKIRMVVEDRRSVLAAFAAAGRFVRRRFWRVLALYALNGLVFIAVLAVWSVLAPGAGAAGFSMWAAFVWSQVYVIARLLMK